MLFYRRYIAICLTYSFRKVHLGTIYHNVRKSQKTEHMNNSDIDVYFFRYIVTQWCPNISHMHVSSTTSLILKEWEWSYHSAPVYWIRRSWVFCRHTTPQLCSSPPSPFLCASWDTCCADRRLFGWLGHTSYLFQPTGRE